MRVYKTWRTDHYTHASDTAGASSEYGSGASIRAHYTMNIRLNKCMSVQGGSERHCCWLVTRSATGRRPVGVYLPRVTTCSAGRIDKYNVCRSVGHDNQPLFVTCYAHVCLIAHNHCTRQKQSRQKTLCLGQPLVNLNARGKCVRLLKAPKQSSHRNGLQTAVTDSLAVSLKVKPSRPEFVRDIDVLSQASSMGLEDSDYRRPTRTPSPSLHYCLSRSASG